MLRSLEEEREERIACEITADAYKAGEQARRWHSYLAGILYFPFSARCLTHRTISPLRPGAELDVVAMAPAEECQHEMFVSVRWHNLEFAVPLMQLESIGADEVTRQAIEDWRYWVEQGYTL